MGHMSTSNIQALLEAVSDDFLPVLSYDILQTFCAFQEVTQKTTMVNVIKATVARSGDEDGQGCLKEIFKRANKAWPWVSQNEPERLCKYCLNTMLEVSFRRSSKFGEQRLIELALGFNL